MEKLTLMLAALPEPEWRTLRASVEYGLKHDDYEPNEIVTMVFPGGLPEIDEWNAAVETVAELRTRAQERDLGDRPVSRREYMRFYMQRRRAKKVQ